MIKGLLRFVFPVLLCAMPGCDAGDGDGDAELDDLVGYWRQNGCSNLDGDEISCIFPLTKARRDLEFRDSGEVVHWWAIDGAPAMPSADGSRLEDGQVCSDVIGCYPLYRDRDTLLYCLNDSACESFEYEG